jgi:hypothetical protein
VAETPPPGLRDAYERRNVALSCLAALDGPTMAKLWQTGSEDTIQYLEQLLTNVSVDARWAANLAGVQPRPLPRSRPSGNGKAPTRHTRR